MAHRHRLSGVPPSEFIKARDALVKELRAAGEAEEAKRIAALRKPSTSLWAANQLGRLAPQHVGALIDSALKIKRAHGAGDADELRAAMQQQRAALQQLIKAAGQASAEIGAQATLEFERRVQNTVQSAAATDAQALREGTLEKELEPAGFEALLGVNISAHPDQPAPAKREEEEERAARESKVAEETAHRLAGHAKELEQAAARAQEAGRKARREADEAMERARRLASRRKP